MNTDGFYKIENDKLLHAPNFVVSPTIELVREKKDSYDYENTEGWRWFDSEDDAYVFYGVEKTELDRDVELEILRSENISLKSEVSRLTVSVNDLQRRVR